MAKGIKSVQVEEIKTKSSTVDNTETHDKGETANQQKLRAEKVRKDPKHYISHHRGHGEISNKVVVKKDGKVAYTNRKVADKLVASGQGYAYATKKEWKTLVRDTNEPKLLEIPVVSK